MIEDYSRAIIKDGHFSWAEYAYLPSYKLYASPSQKEFNNAVKLFSYLEPLRVELGFLLVITSGARTVEYSRYLRRKGIPAALQSAHIDWQAVDLTCPKLSNKALYAFFDKRWLGRMELLHYTPGWVHIDIRAWGQKIRFKP